MTPTGVKANAHVLEFHPSIGELVFYAPQGV